MSRRRGSRRAWPSSAGRRARGEHTALIAEQDTRAAQKDFVIGWFAIRDSPTVATFASPGDVAFAVETDAEDVTVVGGDDHDPPGHSGGTQKRREWSEVFDAVLGVEGAAAELVVDGVDDSGYHAGAGLPERRADGGRQALARLR